MWKCEHVSCREWKVNATGITFTLLADHLPYVPIFLQIHVNQLKRLSRRRGACWMSVCPWCQEKWVNLCCSIGIWWAKACVGVNVKGQSSTRKLCCVQCHAHSGAVHVQLVYRASNGYCKAHKIVICGGSGPEMWLDWWVSLRCLPLHRNYLGSHLWLTHPQDYFNGPIRTMWTQIFYKSQDDT